MQLKSDISTLVVSWLFLQFCYTCALFETLLNNIGLKKRDNLLFCKPVLSLFYYFDPPYNVNIYSPLFYYFDAQCIHESVFSCAEINLHI